MRSVIFSCTVLLLLALPALPAPAKKPPKAESLATIEEILKDLPPGTPAAIVKDRQEFEYDEELKMSLAKINGVAIFIEFHQDKVSRLAITDFNHAHPQLLKTLEEQFGKPETRKAGPRTTHTFNKEGPLRVTLSLVASRMTDLEFVVAEE